MTRSLDILDGVAARRFGASGLGDHLDGMGDVLTFGVLPGLLVIKASGAQGGAWSALLAATAGAYVIGITLRLARYAVLEPPPGGGFRGLPSPSAALATIAAMGLGARGAAPVALMLCIALCTVADFPYPHPRRPLAALFLGVAWAGSVAAIIGAVPVQPWSVAVLCAVTTLPLLARRETAVFSPPGVGAGR